MLTSPSEAAPQRLSEFLRTDASLILREWDEFASTVAHAGKPLDRVALRDHAAQILSALAADLDRPQSDAARDAKSKGEAPRDPRAGDTAAETHADTRVLAGFAIEAMITEYRALRASVLRLWGRKRGDRGPDELEQLTRFNEGVDQAIAESVSRYSEQLDKASNVFIAVLGHDIRNPLNTIRLSTEVLVRSGQMSEAAARPIANGAKRIERLAELMVDFSRAQAAGTMPLARKPGNLEQQLRNIVEETRARHTAAQIKFTADGDFAGEWDEGRMGQLLSNLLENAILYGAAGRPITVSMSANTRTVAFSVNNEGPPIPPEELPRVFDATHRGRAEHDCAPGGLGLGLYICREIARAHEGSIAVRSDASSGTTFDVVLPRLVESKAGELAERLNAPVLKTGDAERRP
jgi:signal transduction histidine kinase